MNLLARLVAHPGPTIAAIGSAMLIAYVTAVLSFPKPGGRLIFGDATHHFVQLRSMVFDRDLNFRNEYVTLYGLAGDEPGTEWVTDELTVTGHVRNYMPVGPALLWLPLYLLLALVQTGLSWAGLAPAPTGFDRALQLAPGISGVLASAVGTWLSFVLARRFTGAASALAGAIAVWVGSHVLYYSMVSPAYSHAASMLASSAFAVAWLVPSKEPTTRRALRLGGLAGAAALMRWQDAIFLLVPIAENLRAPTTWARRLGLSAATGLAWLLVFSPQMVVWQALYGQPFAIPQGPSFLQWSAPHPIAVLLSSNHGLFTWAPILVLAVAGLVTVLRRHPQVATPLVVIVALSWYINAAVVDWWGGEAFGARRFLSLFPYFVLGLSVWIGGPGTRAVPSAGRLAVTGAFVGLNLLLLLQYQLFMKGLGTVAPYPDEWYDLWLARFVVPIRLIGGWLS
jgi:hypothetical protein